MKRVSFHDFAAFAKEVAMTEQDHRVRAIAYGKQERAPDAGRSLIDRLECVARSVEGAERDGEGDDSPEGNVTVVMSHTFAEGLSLLLREAASQLRRTF